MGRWRFWRRDAPPSDRVAQPDDSSASRTDAAAGDARTVVVHYHFFKNAGTSVDATLHENFGSGWVERERVPPARLVGDDLARMIRDEPTIVVISSHTAQMPPPEVPGCTIVPIVFVRHPLDRLRSIYDFERRQDSDSAGAVMAKKLNLTDYLEWRLKRGKGVDATAHSFQSHRLAGSQAPEAERLTLALQRVDALPFVGLVEEFERSIQRLQDLLVGPFPAIHLRAVWENASDRRMSLEERIEQFRRSIPEDLYQRLVVANDDDLALWRNVVERYVAGGPDTPQ